MKDFFDNLEAGFWIFLLGFLIFVAALWLFVKYVLPFLDELRDSLKSLKKSRPKDIIISIVIIALLICGMAYCGKCVRESSSFADHTSTH